MEGVEVIQLKKVLDKRGNLSVIEEIKDIPFSIKRAYWIYDVPGGEERGGHAYLRNKELIVALSGSFDVLLDNGREQNVFHLNRSYYGLYVENGIWRQMKNFSTNSLAFIVSSEDYDESDYIRDYDSFLRLSYDYRR
ncbi:MAG: FdtA/QdtA family cupin domain-containing protein [Bacteroidales bacterium]|nr:FdtA/QdtA family cupin domain-containing protein [Bacteroidales bacterium]